MEKKAKKGEMSMNVIVAAALALLVLFVLAFIFKDQIMGYSSQFKNAGDKAGSKLDKCIDKPNDPSCSPFASSRSGAGGFLLT